MTVSELIEELQRLPGSSDLRFVSLQVVLHRPYAADAKIECWLSAVALEHGEAVIRAFGHLT